MDKRTQQIEALVPWFGQRVTVTYDAYSTYTATNGGVAKFTETTTGTLTGISERLTGRSSGTTYDAVIHLKGCRFVTVSLAKILDVKAAR